MVAAKRRKKPENRQQRTISRVSNDLRALLYINCGQMVSIFLKYLIRKFRDPKMQLLYGFRSVSTIIIVLDDQENALR